MTKAERREHLEGLLLGLLPASGNTVANGQLLTMWTQAAADAGLNASPDDFASLREDLVVRGWVVKGKGRGGSTARTSAAAPGSDTFTLESEAAAAADGVGEVAQATAKPVVGKLAKPGKPKAGAADAGEAAQVLSYRLPTAARTTPKWGWSTRQVIPNRPKPHGLTTPTWTRLYSSTLPVPVPKSSSTMRWPVTTLRPCATP